MQDTEQRTTAYHEAGHVVIARVLGLACGDATITPDEKDGSAGSTIIADPFATAYAWDLELFAKTMRGETGGSYRGPDFALRARAIAQMAGAKAELECIGTCRGGDGDDRYWIGVALEELGIADDKQEAYERRLRCKARGLVRRHRDEIERVAEALLARGTLSGDADDDDEEYCVFLLPISDPTDDDLAE